MSVAAARLGREYEAGDADIARRALLTGDDAATARPIITDGAEQTYPA